jgi:hypothetical protein
MGMVAALEVNDAGLLLVHASDAGREVGTSSPGYARLDGDELLLGAAAELGARLAPRFVHDRFWDRLDTEPLSPPFPSHLTCADLVYAHLRSVLEAAGGERAEEVLLAVPGRYQTTQLGLLLGIARAASARVRGLVDAAVAAVASVRPEGRVLHLDVQLHRSVLTEIEAGDELTRLRVEVADGVGLVSLRDAWARGIAELFVHRTRFDPLHDAATEQRLFDGLSGWLQALCVADTTVVVMETAGQRHSIELTREAVLSLSAASYDRLVQLVGRLKQVDRPATLLLSHRAGELPALRAHLSGFRDMPLAVLPPGASAAGALAHRDQIRKDGDALPFVTHLRPPAGAPPLPASLRPAGGAPARPAASPRRDGVAPTHILFAGQAFPITTRPFVLGVATPPGGVGLRLEGETAGVSRRHCTVRREGPRVLLEDHSTYGSFLNGERVVGQAVLLAGDRLRLGSPGVLIDLIRLVGADGET